MKKKWLYSLVFVLLLSGCSSNRDSVQKLDQSLTEPKEEKAVQKLDESKFHWKD